MLLCLYMWGWTIGGERVLHKEFSPTCMSMQSVSCRPCHRLYQESPNHRAAQLHALPHRHLCSQTQSLRLHVIVVYIYIYVHPETHTHTYTSVMWGLLKVEHGLMMFICGAGRVFVLGCSLRLVWCPYCWKLQHSWRPLRRARFSASHTHTAPAPRAWESREGDGRGKGGGGGWEFGLGTEMPWRGRHVFPLSSLTCLNRIGSRQAGGVRSG